MSINSVKGHSTTTDADPAPQVSKVIPFLARGRALMGVGLLLAPQLLCTLVQLPPHAAANSTILTRMTGAREIGVGAATWLVYRHYTAATPAGTSAAASLLYHVLLWSNVFVDSCDAVGAFLAFLNSPDEVATGAMLAPAALGAAACGLWGLLSVQ